MSPPLRVWNGHGTRARSPVPACVLQPLLLNWRGWARFPCSPSSYTQSRLVAVLEKELQLRKTEEAALPSRSSQPRRKQMHPCLRPGDIGGQCLPMSPGPPHFSAYHLPALILFAGDCLPGEPTVDLCNRPNQTGNATVTTAGAKFDLCWGWASKPQPLVHPGG